MSIQRNRIKIWRSASDLHQMFQDFSYFLKPLPCSAFNPRQSTTAGINTSSFDTVTITHPFHPHFKMQFQVVSIQYCWGEQRVAYRDEIGSLRSVPISWTDRKPGDIFLEISAGRSIVHTEDLMSLKQLIQSLKERTGERRDCDEPKEV